MTATVRCHDCRRPVVRSEPLRDWKGRPYGPKCGRERGLAVGRLVRARPPKRGEVEHQPVLDGMEEINEESEEL